MEKNLNNNFVVEAVLNDLSKAFYCIAHDLLIAKLSAHIFSDETFSYIYSYLKNGINYTHSYLDTIISCVPYGSILRSILFILSINDLFLLMALASLYNFADDNNLSAVVAIV